MSVGLMEDRPPYVTFERRSVEKRKPAPPEGDGSVFYEDVDFVIVTPAGTKDVFIREVAGWFEYLQMVVNQKRYNPKWLVGFQDMYATWKKTNEVPLNGWPVKNWPVATPSEIKRLADARVMTVEDCAQMSEEAIGRVGMGARSLKQRAIDFLEAQAGTGPLVSRMDALTQRNAELTRQNELLTAENRRLSKELETYTLRERGIQQPVAVENPPMEFQPPKELDFENLVKL